MTRISANDVPELAEAIYGGPGVNRGRLAELLDRWGLEPPIDVAAADLPESHPPLRAPRPREWRLLLLHPGIAYLLVPAGERRWIGRLEQEGLVIGDPRSCASAGDLVNDIQQAVLSLRRRQIGGGAVTPLAETQARLLALQRLRAGHPAAGEAVDAWVDIVLSRHQDRLNTVRRKMLEMLCLLTVDTDAAPELAFPFNTAVKRLFDTYRLPSLRQVFRELVDELAPLVGGGEASREDSLAARARAFLAEHYTRDIGLAQVARHLKCSPTHLSRAFRQRYGKTLTEQLQWLRVAHARELLRETDKPLRAVAPAAGFGTVKHFHRVFLARTGTTPAAYRARD